ncbi:MAG: cytochrome d ubiquinol oxidase subunit II [Bacteroidetes bacterium]|nr:cytochrome d ubiquinol oxidase subunit II [Bacteroidota bacterium]
MIVTLAFLMTALAAYTLFGGADFGGGILEATLRGKPHLQKKIEDTLGPVWEANHVWLIAVVVILFVGFPHAYADLSQMLFVPVSLALMGIILRGAFFTFRKYDPEPRRRTRFYTALFRSSSALTPAMYGFIVGALLQPFPVAETGSFFDLYIAPWATLFGLLCALFVFALFGYVAAVLLFGELGQSSDRQVIRRRILQFFGATFVLGGLVLGYGATTGIVAWRDALNPVQIGVQVVALVGIPVLWGAMKADRSWLMRLVAGGQVLAILVGWFSTQYPSFLKWADGTTLLIHDAAAPDVTILWLNIGLAVVLLLVLPLLAYLFRVFRRTEANAVE